MNPEKAEQIRYDAMMDEYRDSVTNSMRDWFLHHYEDPAKNTPYDSSEGGYLYQWGGPYDAREILHDRFGRDAEEDLIDEVADELERISSEWAKIPTLEDLDPLDISPKFLSRFESSMDSIRVELRQTSVDDSNPFKCSLFFAYTITCLEAYLSDAFLTSIKNPRYFRAFIETDPELKNEKLTVSEIYKKMESLQGDAIKRIHSIVFHRLEVVRRMYKDTLGIDFPAGMRELIPAVLRRHDIIHRGCIDKYGTVFIVTKSEVESLISSVDDFITNLNAKISALQK